MGYSAHFVSTDAPGAARRYGNAILSRGPMLVTGQHALQPREHFRVAAHATVEKNGRRFDIFATHLHAGDDGAAVRTRQVHDLLSYIERAGMGGTWLLLGDFNAAASSEELIALQELFFDAYGSVHPKAQANVLQHPTLNPAYFEVPRRIDHVFLQRNRLEVLEARLVLNRTGADGAWPSDHFGVLVRASLRAAVAESAR